MKKAFLTLGVLLTLGGALKAQSSLDDKVKNIPKEVNDLANKSINRVGGYCGGVAKVEFVEERNTKDYTKDGVPDKAILYSLTKSNGEDCDWSNVASYIALVQKGNGDGTYGPVKVIEIFSRDKSDKAIEPKQWPAEEWFKPDTEQYKYP